MSRYLPDSRTLLRAAAIQITVLFLTALLIGPASAATSEDVPLNGLAQTANQVLQNYMTKSSPSDTHFYLNGNWYATDGPSCWFCYDSAATGDATLSQERGGNPQLRSVAVDTFDTAIATYQLPSGAFSDPRPTPDPIGTGFFTVDLGMAYLELDKVLDTHTRTVWKTSIQKAADYLINSGNTVWYTNGNVDLRQTEVLWLAWSITHQQRFLKAYDAEWSFTIAPDQKRWAGFGLHTTVPPTRSDGSDGSGYLGESGGAAPGFDPSYTDTQLDTATDLYVLTRDPRYLRLMNLLFNQLRPRIDSAWTLNATGGSRKSYITPFMNPAVSVLASGHRADLVSSVSPQLKRVESEYMNAETYTNQNFYKGFEAWISMPLLNRQWPQGMAPDTRLAADAAHSQQSSAARRQVSVTLASPTPRRATAASSTGSARRRVSVHRVRSGHLPSIAISNAPLGSTVGVTLVARPAGSATRNIAGRQAATLLGHAIRMRVGRHRSVVLMLLTARQLSLLRGHRWILTAHVTVRNHRVVDRISRTLGSVTFA